MKNKIEFIAFDADDTLWEMNFIFKSWTQICHLLRKYLPAPSISEELFKTEIKKSGYLWLWTERNAALHD